MLGFSLVLPAKFCAAATHSQKPNIIFILADDLGYGDVGVFYQNGRVSEGKPYFSTPNIDALAAAGMMLRQHYTSCPVCAPARASLLTGQTQGDCNVRNNQFDKALAGWTIGDVLQHAGYRTAVIGKWGLGGTPDVEAGRESSNEGGTGAGLDLVAPSHPMHKGFDEFFGFMRHRYGHVYYHDKEHPLMDGYKDVTAQYENIYSTDLFTARAKKFLVDQESQHADRPFFLYLAYTAVHAALQVPGGPYPSGGGLHGGMQWPLTPTPQTRDTWIYPTYAAETGWNDHMKRYATMAHRLDDGVGDIMQLLRDLKIADNTLVIFSSDNGPANEGGADPRYFDSWGPFDGFKRDCWEGGMREPTIACWPGHIKAHSTDDVASAFYDWMPTLAAVAGIAPPAQTDGVSILPTLLHHGAQLSRGYLYSEYFFSGPLKQFSANADVFRRKGVTNRGQQQAVRIGDFVGVRTQVKHADDPLRLYNVMADPHEDHNLASESQYAGLLHQMDDLLVTARRPDPSAKRPYDDVLLPAVQVDNLKKGRLEREEFDGDWPWVPDFDLMTPSSHDSVVGINLPQDLPDHAFGMRFSGYISIPKDGEYTFTATSDGGVHLWLHDAHLISSDDSSVDHPISAKVLLKAGLHPIRLFYRHVKGPGNLTLRYSGPGIDKQRVPATVLGMN